MGTAANVEHEATNFLQKLMEDGTDEPRKLAARLFMMCQHMKTNNKEQTFAYKVISRAMEIVLQQNGINWDALYSSHLIAASQTLWREFAPQSVPNPRAVMGDKDEGQQVNVDGKNHAAGEAVSTFKDQQKQLAPEEIRRHEREVDRLHMTRQAQHHPGGAGSCSKVSGMDSRGNPMVSAMEAPDSSYSTKYPISEEVAAEFHKQDSGLRANVPVQCTSDTGEHDGRPPKRKREKELSQLQGQKAQPNSARSASKNEAPKRYKSKLLELREAKGCATEFPKDHSSSADKRTETHTQSSLPLVSSYQQQALHTTTGGMDSQPSCGQLPQSGTLLEDCSRKASQSRGKPVESSSNGPPFQSIGSSNASSGLKLVPSVGSYGGLAAKLNEQITKGLSSGLTDYRMFNMHNLVSRHGDDNRQTSGKLLIDQKQPEPLTLSGSMSNSGLVSMGGRGKGSAEMGAKTNDHAQFHDSVTNVGSNELLTSPLYHRHTPSLYAMEAENNTISAQQNLYPYSRERMTHSSVGPAMGRASNAHVLPLHKAEGMAGLAEEDFGNAPTYGVSNQRQQNMRADSTVDNSTRTLCKIDHGDQSLTKGNMHTQINTGIEGSSLDLQGHMVKAGNTTRGAFSLYTTRPTAQQYAWPSMQSPFIQETAYESIRAGCPNQSRLGSTVDDSKQHSPDLSMTGSSLDWAAMAGPGSHEMGFRQAPSKFNPSAHDNSQDSSGWMKTPGALLSAEQTYMQDKNMTIFPDVQSGNQSNAQMSQSRNGVFATHNNVGAPFTLRANDVMLESTGPSTVSHSGEATDLSLGPGPPTDNVPNANIDSSDTRNVTLENLQSQQRRLDGRSWRSPFSDHQLKQLRAQCLVFLSLRNKAAPKMLHLALALDKVAQKADNGRAGVQIRLEARPEYIRKVANVSDIENLAAEDATRESSSAYRDKGRTNPHSKEQLDYDESMSVKEPTEAVLGNQAPAALPKASASLDSHGSDQQNTDSTTKGVRVKRKYTRADPSLSKEERKLASLARRKERLAISKESSLQHSKNSLPGKKGLQASQPADSGQGTEDVAIENSRDRQESVPTSGSLNLSGRLQNMHALQQEPSMQARTEHLPFGSFPEHRQGNDAGCLNMNAGPAGCQSANMRPFTGNLVDGQNRLVSLPNGEMGGPETSMQSMKYPGAYQGAYNASLGPVEGCASISNVATFHSMTNMSSSTGMGRASNEVQPQKASGFTNFESDGVELHEKQRIGNTQVFDDLGKRSFVDTNIEALMLGYEDGNKQVANVTAPSNGIETAMDGAPIPTTSETGTMVTADVSAGIEDRSREAEEEEVNDDKEQLEQEEEEAKEKEEDMDYNHLDIAHPCPPRLEYTTIEKWTLDQEKKKQLDEQSWAEKQRKTEERIAVRFHQLKDAVSSSQDISVRTKSVIELKKLELLQLQRRLRRDFLHDFFKPIKADIDLLRGMKKTRPGRRMKQLERLETKQKEERLRRIRERQKEFLREVESHKEKLDDWFKVKRERIRGCNRYVKEFHKKRDRAHREKLERIQREKINLLKNNDVEGYLRMVKDAKSDRVKQLLKETEGYLQTLGVKLQQQKMQGRESESYMDAECLDAGSLGDQDQHYLESNEKYYLMAHSVKEIVQEQPAGLVGGKLREYQLNGLRWMVSLYNNSLNGILADEMGLGKTVQVIALLSYLISYKNDRGPFLVVVPSSVLPNWASELNTWAPSIIKVAYTGTPEERRRIFREKVVQQQFNVLLTTYEYLMNKHDRPKLCKIPWHYIIIDEGHRIKNANCKLNAELKNYQSSHRLLLTGTPLQNKLEELWALLNFLLPSIFNSAEDFAQWFNKPFENVTDAATDQALLTEEENLLIINRLHQVLRPFVLRRLKQKVESELPEKIERLVRCKPSAYQQLLMKRVKEKLGSLGHARARAVHNSVIELRNICNHPYLSHLHTEEAERLFPVHYLPPVVRLCGKLEMLDRILPKLKDCNHRVLLFSTMTRLLDVLEDYLTWRGFRYLRLDGHTSGSDRGALIDLFNSPDSDAFLFLLSIRAGGVGINLQAADTVILFDTDWNPQVDLQAQARAHRIGQKRDVLVLRLETVQTVEEQVRAAAEHKLGVANQSITAGFFDNNTSAEDRKEYLEALLRESKKEEVAPVLDDEALNYLLARNESEIDVFEAVDKARIEAEQCAWRKCLEEMNCLEPLVAAPRLLQESELTELLRFMQSTDDGKAEEKHKKGPAVALDTQHYGRGKRAREVRSYGDQLSEQEFEELCQVEESENARKRDNERGKSKSKTKPQENGDDAASATSVQPSLGKRPRGRPKKINVSGTFTSSGPPTCPKPAATMVTCPLDDPQRMDPQSIQSSASHDLQARQQYEASVVLEGAYIHHEVQGSEELLDVPDEQKVGRQVQVGRSMLIEQVGRFEQRGTLIIENECWGKTEHPLAKASQASDECLEQVIPTQAHYDQKGDVENYIVGINDDSQVSMKEMPVSLDEHGLVNVQVVEEPNHRSDPEFVSNQVKGEVKLHEMPHECTDVVSAGYLIAAKLDTVCDSMKVVQERDGFQNSECTMGFTGDVLTKEDQQSSLKGSEPTPAGS